MSKIKSFIKRKVFLLDDLNEANSYLKYIGSAFVILGILYFFG
ncbi:hypothetical protein [Lentibacillus cibarius]|nr:hypothetical protein [Lentibacillus cibarius]